jgi:large subunit ribosomal protein L27
MATKLTGSGRISQYRDPIPKFYGIKLSNGSFAKGGSIIVTQKGNKYHPGMNVVQGRNFSINSCIDGIVSFRKENDKFRTKKIKVFVDVIPIETGTSKE